MHIKATQTLNRLLESLYNKGVPVEALKQVVIGMEDYISQWNKGLAEGLTDLELYRMILKMFDKELGEERKPYDKYIKCKKGCSFCCHINVDVTEVEAKLVWDYVQEHNIPVNEALLEKQRYLGNDERMLSPDSKCAFLSAEGTCNIYPVRPLECRKYFVVSDPKLCNGKENPHGQVQSPAFLHSEIIASAMANTKQKHGNFSDLLMQTKPVCQK